jgi:gamma-butyrobetaine dioxygenase
MPELASIDPRADGVGVSWDTGAESFFHHVWLRETCFCESCGDCYSSNRHMVVSDLPERIAPRTVSLDSKGKLIIDWEPDGHRSTHGGDWLHRNRYDDAARDARRPRPVLWNAAAMTDPPRVSFDAARHDEGARMTLYRAVRDHGFCVVEGGPAEPNGLLETAKLMGAVSEAAYGAVFDLSPANTIGTLGATFHEVPPHTDEPFRYMPPGLLILGCVRPAEKGGDTILVDGFQIAETLRDEAPDAFALLCEPNHVFVRYHAGKLDERMRGKAISRDDRGAVCGIRLHTRSTAPLDVPSDLVPAYFAAHRALVAKAMAPENQLRLRLAAGDVAVLDNHRVLHSRTAFTDSRRFLQTSSVLREDFHENLRLLAAKLGFQDEADQALPSGAVC